MQRLDRVLRVQRKNYFKTEIFHIFYQISFFKFFLWPRSLSLCPPTTPESFTLMGSAMCEIIRVHRRKSALLGYQSLAHYRSLGFDKMGLCRLCKNCSLIKLSTTFITPSNSLLTDKKEGREVRAIRRAAEVLAQIYVRNRH